MNLIAQAVLSRIQGNKERISTLRVVALDHQPGDDAAARHVVTLQTTHLKAGLAEGVDESTLTPMPVTLALARQFKEAPSTGPFTWQSNLLPSHQHRLHQ